MFKIFGTEWNTHIVVTPNDNDVFTLETKNDDKRAKTHNEIDLDREGAVKLYSALAIFLQKATP